ncbi:MAG TPA: sigma-70 family RNA polymerase sigma factor [Vicinamibacterales bacterium]|nr:sigma-70 family RNA polymerase sigma factor [Vicinamibacterales bacterium]
MEPTSWRLLAGARRGDSSAVGELVRRCLSPLRAWAHGRLPRWARAAADTSDLIQDAWLRTLGRLDTFEPQGRHALGAYLREAVRNRIRDEHRRLARSGISCALPDALADSAPSPLDRAIAAETEARYRAALARLTQADREIIVAHVELDYTHEQLGCMTGRSPNAARMALHRAVGRLAESMRER